LYLSAHHKLRSQYYLTEMHVAGFSDHVPFSLQQNTENICFAVEFSVVKQPYSEKTAEIC
jgi:hypothetical protein